MGLKNDYKIVPLSGGLNFGSVTATTAATANTILSPLNPYRILIISNTLNQPICLTFGGVAGPEILTSATLTLDFGASDVHSDAGQTIGVFATGTGPSSGRIAACLL